MWRRGITQRGLVATRLTMTSQHREETWKYISNHSMHLKGEKWSMKALRVEGYSYIIKRGSLQIREAATTGL